MLITPQRRAYFHPIMAVRGYCMRTTMDSTLVPSTQAHSLVVFIPKQAGNLLWRGTFEHSANLSVPTAINISVSGGINFAASAWLNGQYLGASDTRLATNNESWPVTVDMLQNGDNYVTVLQE